MTMEQVVTQLQQELFTLRAHVAAQSGLPVERSTISRQLKFGETLGDSSMLKASIVPRNTKGKRRTCQHWWKRTEAFFAGVINESEMTLEWAVEQRTDTNEDREVQNLEFVLQHMHADSSPSRVMWRMRLSPTRRRIRWRHGGG